MNKPLRFSSKTHKLLWCSDFHCQHSPNWDSPPLWSTRGFSSIQEHDAWVKAKWFEMVDDQTVVFALGDTVFSDPKGEWFRQFTTWPGDIRCWNGNHVSGHRQIYREAAKARGFADHELVYPLKVNNLTFVGDQLLMWIDGVSVYCQHYAPLIWPEMKAGHYALAGHSHGRCPELNPGDATHGRIMDVGTDNAITFNGTPFFSWQEIQRIMQGKPIVCRDHH